MLTDDEIVAVYSAGEFTLPHREFVIDAGRKIIAAYQAMLGQGVELPEPVAHGFVNNGRISDALVIGHNDDAEYNVPLVTADQLQQYGDARDQAGYLRGLDDAKRVCDDAVTELIAAESNKDLFELAVGIRDAIQKLKGGE